MPRRDVYKRQIEGNLDLRNSSGSGRNAIQLEQAKLLVIPGKLTLTLEHVDLYLGPVSYTHLQRLAA